MIEILDCCGYVVQLERVLSGSGKLMTFLHLDTPDYKQTDLLVLAAIGDCEHIAAHICCGSRVQVQAWIHIEGKGVILGDIDLIDGRYDPKPLAVGEMCGFSTFDCPDIDDYP